MTEAFEQKPRWPGAPPICIRANLLAFESSAAMMKWIDDKIGPYIVQLKWQCSACRMWHNWGHGIGPSGGSSGTKRKCAVPERIWQLIKETKIPEAV